MKYLQFIILLSFGLLTNKMALAACTTQSASITLTKPDSIYINNNDGTVSDKNTGLMWQQCALGLSGADCSSGEMTVLNWRDALIAASQNTAAGYTDWRLPNKNELSSLVEVACYRPAINIAFFPLPVGSNYDFWSSTPYSFISDFGRVWGVGFESGSVSPYNVKTSYMFTRLVRGIDRLSTATLTQSSLE